MTAIRMLIDTLKRRADNMARPFIDAARQPDASDSERAFGEAARLILRDAEARAQQLRQGLQGLAPPPRSDVAA